MWCSHPATGDGCWSSRPARHDCRAQQDNTRMVDTRICRCQQAHSANEATVLERPMKEQPAGAAGYPQRLEAPACVKNVLKSTAALPSGVRQLLMQQQAEGHARLEALTVLMKRAASSGCTMPFCCRKPLLSRISLYTSKTWARLGMLSAAQRTQPAHAPTPTP